jgi:F-type H+-transporting ATPase subunit delta
MTDHKVSLRYATSLLDSAVEKKILDSTIKDMELVCSTLEQNSQLTFMLKSPVIKPLLKSSVLTELFEKKITADSLQFILFVVFKKREDLLVNITRKFLELKDEYLGILNVDIIAPYEFSDVQKELVKNKFESNFNKIIKLNFVQDKNLIGGFIAKVADTMYDASVKHQLELLRKQFLHGKVSLN